MTGCDYVTAFDEFLRCMKRNVSTTVLTVLLIVCCILFFCYILYYYNVDDGSVVIKENEMYLDHTIFRFGKADYSLFQSKENPHIAVNPFVDNKTDEELYDHALLLDRMIKEIRENGFLDYFFSSTSVQIPFSDVNNNIEMLKGYAEQGDRARWSPKYKDAGYIVVQAADVDMGFIEHSNLILSSGRLLTKEDFDEFYANYSEGAPLPVLLGNKYADYYKVGDIIHTYKSVYEHDQKFEKFQNPPLKVIGILEKDTIVFNSFVSAGTNMLENLDYTIIMPERYWSRTVSDYDINNVAAIAAVASIMHEKLFINTAFYFDRSKLEYGRDKLTEILDKYGFTGYYTVQNSDYSVELSESIMKERVTGLSVISALVGVFTFFAIVITQLNKYNRNRKSYAIYMLTGRTVKDIVLMAVFDITLHFAAALCLSHIPLIILLFPESYGGTRLFNIIKAVYNPELYVYMLVLGAALALVCAVLCYFTVRKTDIVSLIKDGE